MDCKQLLTSSNPNPDLNPDLNPYFNLHPHARLILILEKCNAEYDQKEFPAVLFKSVSIDHMYVAKKTPKG
jgi:hypothetical protein